MLLEINVLEIGLPRFKSLGRKKVSVTKVSSADVYKLFQTKNTQDIGTSAPVQEVQQFVSPQPVSILDQLAPKGAQKVVPSILEQLKGGTVGSATVATAKEAPAVSVSDLFGGQLRVGN